MARNLRLTSLAANAEADAIAALVDGGYLRIYGDLQPVSGDTPTSGQTLLAELRFGTPAFSAAVNGVATAEPLTGEDAALASGVATWFRVLQADSTTRVFDGSVGAGGLFDLVLSSASIQLGAEVSVSSFTVTAPQS